MKLSRLSGRKVNERVLRKGEVWRGKTMMIRWLPGPPRNPNIDPSKRALYTGTAASAKLHKSAVKRNRMRRRCREALRVAVQAIDTLPTTQILLTPRIKSLDCDYSLIQEDVAAFLAMISRTR